MKQDNHEKAICSAKTTAITQQLVADGDCHLANGQGTAPHT
jgi:hypothetical protein